MTTSVKINKKPLADLLNSDPKLTGDDCPICYDTFNQSTRKLIKCPYCPSVFCKTCCETYMLGSIVDPHCMGCKKAWLREFLFDNFPKAFIDVRLRKHRETIIFEREKALLPVTLPFVEEIKRLKKQKVLDHELHC